MKGKSEIVMYHPFVEAFQPCCPEMLIVDNHSSPFQDREERDIKPNVTCYQQRFKFTISGRLSKPEIDKVALMAEAKNFRRDDPFDDDIDRHITRTSDFEHKPWVKATGTLRFQTFRLVLHEVAYPIQLFSNTKQLVQAFRDALEAHRLAYDNAKILHRDISPGNIMITEEGRGLLIDWDSSKDLLVNVEAVSPAERTGTWQFMAARLIRARAPGDPVPVPNREDDLESFRHVLLWTALRRCEHKMSVQGIVDSLRLLFDHSYVGASGLPKGGHMKLSELMSKTTVFEMKLGSNPLQEILLATADVLASRYLETERLEDQIRKVEEIWVEVRTKYHNLQEDDIQIRKAFHSERFGIADDTVHLWRSRRILASSQWMEAIFQTALDDSQIDWDTGSANIQRSH